MQKIITPQQLHAQIANPNCVIIDTNWFLPTDKRDAYQEYLNEHIPQAGFFNIDACCDKSNPLPHSLPTAQIFSETMQTLSVNKDSQVYVYDRMGYFSAPRLLWMLNYFGHTQAAIIDGGLAAWKNQNLPTSDNLPQLPKGNFKAQAQPHKLASKETILAAIHGEKNATIIDARSKARFYGEVEEPRPNLRKGHMPNAHNIPFNHCFNTQNGQFKNTQQLNSLLKDTLPHDKKTPIICSCGSGITACTLILALNSLGYDNTLLYDGSWSEWGADNKLPIQ